MTTSLRLYLSQSTAKDTIEHVSLYYASDPVAQPEDEAMLDANATLWKSVFEEDIAVVEGMQRGRHGTFFDGGKFSPVMDKPTHNFHQWVATQVDKGRLDDNA